MPHNVVRDALESLVRVFEASPAKARVMNAPARARLLEGLRCSVDVRALAQWGDAHSPVGCTVRRGLNHAVEIEVAAP